MKPKNIYLLLCVLGIALPYSEFVPWVISNGLNVRLFLHQLIANRISCFFRRGRAGFSNRIAYLRATGKIAARLSALAASLTHSWRFPWSAAIPLPARE